MFAKGSIRKRNPSISDSSFDAVEYGDNIYTLHTKEKNDNSTAQFTTEFDEQIHIDYPPKIENRLKKITLSVILYLAFSINVLVILLLVPNRFTSELSATIPTALSSIWKSKPADIAAQPLELQLKNMALSVMQFNDWDAQKLKRIDLSWQSLSDTQKNKLKQEVWFQLFENALVNELNMAKNNTNSSATIASAALALTTLAKTLNLRNLPEYNVAKTEKEKSIKTAPTRVQASTVVKKNISTPVSTHKTISSMPVKKTPVKTIPEKQMHKIVKAPLQKKELKPNTKILTHIQSNGPTLSELNDITVQFVDSYEEGNLKKLMSLFSMKAMSNRFNNINAIEQGYADLFHSTSERQIFINDLKWTYSKGKAVGKGTMETVLLTDTDSKVRSRNSRVQLVVEKLGKSTRITRFYELER